MVRFKRYFKYVQNERGGEAQGHFWKMSKKKAFFSDVFPKGSHHLKNLLFGKSPKKGGGVMPESKFFKEPFVVVCL